MDKSALLSMFFLTSVRGMEEIELNSLIVDPIGKCDLHGARACTRAVRNGLVFS